MRRKFARYFLDPSEFFNLETLLVQVAEKRSQAFAQRGWPRGGSSCFHAVLGRKKINFNAPKVAPPSFIASKILMFSPTLYGVPILRAAEDSAHFVDQIESQKPLNPALQVTLCNPFSRIAERSCAGGFSTTRQLTAAHIRTAASRHVPCPLADASRGMGGGSQRRNVLSSSPVPRAKATASANPEDALTRLRTACRVFRPLTPAPGSCSLAAACSGSQCLSSRTPWGEEAQAFRPPHARPGAGRATTKDFTAQRTVQ